MVERKRTLASRPPDAAQSFVVGDDEPPYPFNRVLKDLPFEPYRCTKCQYFASGEEYNGLPRSTPLVHPLGKQHGVYLVCPFGEGPDRAELLSPSKESFRTRVTHNVLGRKITACMLGGVTERTAKGWRFGTLISEQDLMRELYLGRYLEEFGPLSDLDLECLVAAPLMLRNVQKTGQLYLSSLHARWHSDAWEQRADELSFRIQGQRPGFLSSDIARACDPRRGDKMMSRNRFLFVPFDLSLSLEQQWADVLPWLDKLASYAYRFTTVKRPRRRSSLYRDVFMFLSVVVEGRTVFSVARELFPADERLSREKRVREAVRKIGNVVRKSRIALPQSRGGAMPE